MARQATTTAPVNTVEPTIVKCGITSMTVYNSGDGSIRYRVGIDQEIDAMKRDENGDYAIAKVNYIDFVPAVLIAQCISHISGLDLMYTKKKEQALRNDSQNGFGAAELQVVLGKAKLEIKRTKFEVGEEYTTKSGEVLVHDHEGFNTDIVGIKVSDRTQLKLDEMLDKVFEW